MKLRAPKIFNLRRDPFERADESSDTYWGFVISHGYSIYGMQAAVAHIALAGPRARGFSVKVECRPTSTTGC